MPAMVDYNEHQFATPFTNFPTQQQEENSFIINDINNKSLMNLEIPQYNEYNGLLLGDQDMTNFF